MSSFLFRCLPIVALIVLSLSSIYKEVGVEKTIIRVDNRHYILIDSVNYYIDSSIEYDYPNSNVNITSTNIALVISYDSNIISLNNKTLISRKPPILIDNQVWIFEDDWKDLIKLLAKQ